MARQGLARIGDAQLGREFVAWRGKVRRGSTRLGMGYMARHRMDWLGVERLGGVRLGMAWDSRRGWARYGMEGHGLARRGKDYTVRASFVNQVAEAVKMNDIIDGRLRYEPLVDAIMQMDYQSTISREEISRIIDEPVGTRKFYKLVGQARKKLLIRGRILRTVKEQGYMLLHPDECAEVAVSFYERGGKSISYGQKILNYANTDEMSPDALVRHKEVCAKAYAVHAGIQGAAVELNLLSRKHPYNQISVR